MANTEHGRISPNFDEVIDQITRALAFGDAFPEIISVEPEKLLDYASWELKLDDINRHIDETHNSDNAKYVKKLFERNEHCHEYPDFAQKYSDKQFPNG